jgi:glucokinase
MPVIGLDLGGTKLSAAVFTDEGEIIMREAARLEKKAGKEVGTLIIQVINRLLHMAGEKNLDITSIGICVPGIAYAKNGKVAVRIDSDRACSILGEVWKGNAQGCADAIFIAVGTGIGAGLLVNNEVVRGNSDIAGATGWMALQRPFHEKFKRCGCFEYYASGEGLVTMAKEFIASGNFANAEMSNIEADFSAHDIFEACDRNDPLAIAVVNNAIELWGMAAANFISLFNPQKILFGGGVFGPGLKFLDSISKEAAKWAQPISMTQVSIQESALGTDAALYGAGYLALK